MDRPYVKVGKIGYLANKTLPIFLVSRNAVVNTGVYLCFLFLFWRCPVEKMHAHPRILFSLHLKKC